MDEMLRFRNFLNHYLEVNTDIDNLKDINSFKEALLPLIYELFSHIDTLERFNLSLKEKLDKKNIVYLEARYKALQKLCLDLTGQLMDSYNDNSTFLKDLIFDLKDLKENKILKNYPDEDTSIINKSLLKIGIKIRESSNEKENSIKRLKELRETLEEDNLKKDILTIIEEDDNIEYTDGEKND